MESWRKVWREGVAPLLSDDALEAVRKALDEDDQKLIQGATTTPPPLLALSDWDCEAACLIGYAGWRGDGLTKVGDVEEFFARMCHAIDNAVGEPAGCRWFLNWFDETPRPEMRQNLLEEVILEQSRRAAEDAARGGLVEEVNS